MYSWMLTRGVTPALASIFNQRCLSTSQAMLVKNYYAILGLERSCDPKEIRPRYMELCKLHHPDTITSGNEKELQEKKNLFQDINEAYTQLSRKETRTEHDYELDLYEEEKRIRNNQYRYSGHSYNYEYSPGWRVFNEENDRFWNTGWQDDFIKEEKRRMKQRQKARKMRREEERYRREEAYDEMFECIREETDFHRKMVKKMESQVYRADCQRRPDIVNLWNQTLNMYDENVLKPNDHHLHVYPDEVRRNKKAKKAKRKSRHFMFDD